MTFGIFRMKRFPQRLRERRRRGHWRRPNSKPLRMRFAFTSWARAATRGTLRTIAHAPSDRSQLRAEKSAVPEMTQRSHHAAQWAPTALGLRLRPCIAAST